MSTIHACLLSPGDASPRLLTKMLEASAYWQPDAYTRAANTGQNCTLGKAALFNTPGSEHDGVYHDTASGLMICANARLDNRAALGRRLRLAADVSTSRLILHAYQQWGQACPKYLLGDFVFILWDAPRRRLFCARDPFGIKTLFYSRSRRGVMLSNEHNAFFSSAWQPKVLREKWLVQRLWGLRPTPFESPYAGIEVLPAAHSLTIDPHKIQCQRYWQLQQSDAWRGMNDEAHIQELEQCFERAVARRIDSAYPMGAELSEGLDSSGIVGFGARQLGTKPLYTLSYQCELETEQNRPVWHDTYQDLYAMHHLHPNIKPLWQTISNFFPENQITAFFSHFGGILDINGGHFLRSERAAQQGIRTLLSGWGGDHCVTSCGNFYESELLQQGRIGALHQLLTDKHRRQRGGHPVKEWLWLLLKHYAPSLHRQQRSCRGLEKALQQRAQAHFLKRAYRDRFHCDQHLQQFIDHYQEGRSVQQYERRELFDIGVENRLTESELCGRMARMEYRYPMLDVELVEYAYNLPGHLKIYKGLERYHFRRILEGIVPSRTQWRRKADVDHPKIDFQQEIAVWRVKLQKALENNPWAQRYCDRQALNIQLQQAPMHELMRLNLLVHLQQQPLIEID